MAEIKTAAAERWCAAVNAAGNWGEWSYALVRKPGEVAKVIERAVKGTSA